MNADNNDWLNWQSVIGSRKVWRFSPNAANSDFTATNIHVTSHGTEFTLQTPTGSVDVLLPLPPIALPLVTTSREASDLTRLAA